MADRLPKRGLLLFVVVLAAGALVRIAAGVPLASTTLVFTPEARQPASPTDAPEQVAATFYSLLSRGEYKRAWKISVEPHWAGAEKAAFEDAVTSSGAPSGWTGAEEFAKRCLQELGAGGSRLQLGGIYVAPLDARVRDDERPVIDMLRPAATKVVRVTGRLVSGCSVFAWRRDLTVLNLGGEYKILLPGTKPANGLFYREWFSDLERTGDAEGGPR